MRNNQSFNQLRRVIREILLEMTLKGTMPVAASIDDRDENDRVLDRSALGKFHSSKKFLKDASWVFEDFPQDIYILPISGNTRGPRGFTLDAEEALEYLEENVEGVDLTEISQKLSEGATIIASYTSELRKGFLPTAWMILHALLDDLDGSRIGQLGSLHANLTNYLTEIESGHMYLTLVRCLTMKSATGGEIPKDDEAYEDVAAEIIVQEVATRRGFHLDMSQEAMDYASKKGLNWSEFEDYANGLLHLVKSTDMKQRFISSLESSGGMLIVVRTYTGF